MDVGTWTGRPLAQVRRTRLWKRADPSPSHVRFPEGEAFADAQARALTEIDAIAARHPRGRVAVGSHGDIIRMLIAHFSGAHLDQFQRTMADPASVSVVHLGEAGPHVLLVNDTGGLERFRSPHAEAHRRTEPARIGRMDLGPVDRITADAVGEPGVRTFYLQARAGTDLVTLIVEKEQVRAARRVGARAAGDDSDSRPAPGPDEDEMDLEEPFEPRWRAGRLSIGYEAGPDQFLLEIEEFQPELEERRPAAPAAGGRRSRSGCSRPASRCWRSRGTRRPWSDRGRPTCQYCGNPIDPEGHACPAMNGHSKRGPDRLARPGGARLRRARAAGAAAELVQLHIPGARDRRRGTGPRGLQAASRRDAALGLPRGDALPA